MGRLGAAAAAARWRRLRRTLGDGAPVTVWPPESGGAGQGPQSSRAACVPLSSPSRNQRGQRVGGPAGGEPCTCLCCGGRDDPGPGGSASPSPAPGPTRSRDFGPGLWGPERLRSLSSLTDPNSLLSSSPDPPEPPASGPSPPGAPENHLGRFLKVQTQDPPERGSVARPQGGPRAWAYRQVRLTPRPETKQADGRPAGLHTHDRHPEKV